MSLERHHVLGHLAALVGIFIWGLTFVSTKILLEGFTSPWKFFFPV